MRETLHTISPLTSPMDQMRSKRGIIISLVILVAVVAGIIWMVLHRASNTVNSALTDEQKQALVADYQSKTKSGPALTPAQKESLVQAQSKVVADAPSLTSDQKAEIIKQMNKR